MVASTAPRGRDVRPGSKAALQIEAPLPTDTCQARPEGRVEWPCAQGRIKSRQALAGGALRGDRAIAHDADGTPTALLGSPGEAALRRDRRGAAPCHRPCRAHVIADAMRDRRVARHGENDPACKSRASAFRRSPYSARPAATHHEINDRARVLGQGRAQLDCSTASTEPAIRQYQASRASPRTVERDLMDSAAPAGQRRPPALRREGLGRSS